jgi:hypothetical protein
MVLRAVAALVAVATMLSADEARAQSFINVLTGGTVLGNSGAAGEWRLCANGQCRTLSDVFGHAIGANFTTMQACK